MIPPFDIFRVLQDGQPLWLESASTVEDARARIKKLGEFCPGEYLILSQKTGHKLSILVD